MGKMKDWLIDVQDAVEDAGLTYKLFGPRVGFNEELLADQICPSWDALVIDYAQLMGQAKSPETIVNWVSWEVSRQMFEHKMWIENPEYMGMQEYLQSFDPNDQYDGDLYF